jgi:Bacterial Ig domain
MQSTKSLLYAAALMALAATACHKHEHDKDDTVNPVVKITAPESGAISSGPVNITATITDENSLHEYTLVITDNTTNAELFRQKKSIHNETAHNLNVTWTPQGLTAETLVNLNITAIDHGDNTTSVGVAFKAKSL